MAEKYCKSDAEWKEVLTPQQYEITRCKGTEPPFSGRFWNAKGKGRYRCVCCGEELFGSEAKYDSGTGWPSFYEPVRRESVGEASDVSHGMIRTEVTCSACDAHLGHVFGDGPRPTGRRYCINSGALDFDESGE